MGWLKRLFGRREPRDLHAMVLDRKGAWNRYDAARTTDDNSRHWIHADNLSADAANSPEVRRLLRNRTRYEVANNSYARGIVDTLANDLIGTGPRLQVTTDDPDLNKLIEREFTAWARAVRLAEKLRTLRKARAQDGEGFGMLVSNEGLPTRVRLDVSLVEADRVTTPEIRLDDQAVDGIELDRFGNPRTYHVLENHPGDSSSDPLSYARVAAESMIHWFKADRPGQHRGVPDLTPALGMFASLRRYREAVIAAAETAADWAVFFHTKAPPDGDTDPVEPMSTVEVEKRMATALPGGWEATQMRPEQPGTNHVEYVNSIIAEIARCLNMPFNIAAGNSSGYNYASGRLDHQTYFRSISVEQSHLERVVLDRILAAWLVEARIAYGLTASAVPHTWFWDGFEHVDPAKEAMAEERRLKNGTTNLAIECARQGHDWENVQDQRLREQAREEKRRREIRGEYGLAPEPEPEEETVDAAA